MTKTNAMRMLDKADHIRVSMWQIELLILLRQLPQTAFYIVLIRLFIAGIEAGEAVFAVIVGGQTVEFIRRDKKQIARPDVVGAVRNAAFAASGNDQRQMIIIHLSSSVSPRRIFVRPPQHGKMDVGKSQFIQHRGTSLRYSLSLLLSKFKA